MATRFDMFNHIQFSSFRLAKSHIPAQAVDETKESIIGTSESVKFFKMMYRKPHPKKAMPKVITNSFLELLVIELAADLLREFHTAQP